MEGFRRAFEINPKFAEAGLRLAEAHFSIGAVALQAGRQSEALDSFRRAFEINPKFAEAGVRLADIALASGEAVLARDVYRRVLDLAPEVPDAHTAQPLRTWNSAASRRPLLPFSGRAIGKIIRPRSWRRPSCRCSPNVEAREA